MSHELLSSKHAPKVILENVLKASIFTKRLSLSAPLAKSNVVLNSIFDLALHLSLSLPLCSLQTVLSILSSLGTNATACNRSSIPHPIPLSAAAHAGMELQSLLGASRALWRRGAGRAREPQPKPLLNRVLGCQISTMCLLSLVSLHRSSAAAVPSQHPPWPLLRCSVCGGVSRKQRWRPLVPVLSSSG